MDSSASEAKSGMGLTNSQMNPPANMDDLYDNDMIMNESKYRKAKRHHHHHHEKSSWSRTFTFVIVVVLIAIAIYFGLYFLKGDWENPSCVSPPSPPLHPRPPHHLHIIHPHNLHHGQNPHKDQHDSHSESESDHDHDHDHKDHPEHFHHNHHHYPLYKPRPINRFSEYPEITGLYFDKSRQSVLSLRKDPKDEMKFIVTNKTFEETTIGEFVDTRTIRVQYVGGVAEAKLIVNSENHVTCINWKLNTEQTDPYNYWTLVSTKPRSNNPNDYCQLIQSVTELKASSLFGWSVSQNRALYLNKAQPYQSYDGTSAGNDWKIFGSIV
jgi:hypothetical protein